MKASEPAAASEAELRGAISKWLVGYFPRHLIVTGGELDWIILVPPISQPGVRFIEFKVRTRGRQRVGVGRKNGGSQIKLLMPPWIECPIVRWCIADLTRPLGSAHYAFVTSRELARYAVGGKVSPRKQNNIRIDDLLRRKRLGLDWCGLLTEIEKFISAG